MRNRRLLSGIVVLLAFDAVDAAPVVIGGSPVAPPPFWPTSFWGVTPHIDRAFPFTVPAGGPFLVEQAQVALYHYANLAGDRATFTINTDSGGVPGTSLATFEVTGISTTAQVMTAPPQESVALESGFTYWFVGRTPYGQVNWNLGDNAFGTAAYRVDSSDWTILLNTNVSAFAILGSPVPEPATLSLFALGGLAVLRYRRR